MQRPLWGHLYRNRMASQLHRLSWFGPCYLCTPCRCSLGPGYVFADLNLGVLYLFAVSSLGVYDLTKFERDGKKWVKFSLQAEKDSKVFEYPIYDTVKIKQQSRMKAEERIEIKLAIKVGQKEYRSQIFNLADRSHLEFQVLIGRNFLKDIALVDVSKKHLLGGE